MISHLLYHLTQYYVYVFFGGGILLSRYVLAIAKGESPSNGENKKNQFSNNNQFQIAEWTFDSDAGCAQRTGTIPTV